MRCPECSSLNIRVASTRSDGHQNIPAKVRPHMDGNAVWRRRKCLECEHPWDTVEKEPASNPFKNYGL